MSDLFRNHIVCFPTRRLISYHSVSMNPGPRPAPYPPAHCHPCPVGVVCFPGRGRQQRDWGRGSGCRGLTSYGRRPSSSCC